MFSITAKLPLSDSNGDSTNGIVTFIAPTVSATRTLVGILLGSDAQDINIVEVPEVTL